MALQSQLSLRIVLWSFAALLVVQAIWLLSVEIVRPQLPYFPADRASALMAQSKRTQAGLAAILGGARGELWVDDAVALAAGPISAISGGRSTDEPGILERAEAAALRGARLSPHDSRAWLLLASTAQQLKRPDRVIAADLKMSYYTGPSEAALMPLRSRIATRVDLGGDDELQVLVGQDLRTMVLRRPELKPDIVAAYAQASPAGKHLIETTIAPLDPALLSTIRGQQPVR
jgi:hypothetical protein